MAFADAWLSDGSIGISMGKKKSTPVNWSDRSRQLASFARFKEQYDKRSYSCWRCGARDFLKARSKKRAADPETRYLLPQRTLCRHCWAEAKTIRKSLGEFREKWARSEAALEKDKLFLSGWLRMLKELEAYGGEEDATRKNALNKLIRRDELEIWEYFRNVVDSEMLKQISESNYGYCSDEHLAALSEILSCGILPKRMEWIPREVLRLSKWSECMGADTRCLVQVFFCSFVLLAASVEPESSDLAEEHSTEMIIAVDSASRLGVEQAELLHAFLLHVTSEIQLEDIVSKEDFLYYHLSLYVLSVMLEKSPDFITTVLRKTVEWEELVANSRGASKDIFGHTFYDQRKSLWRRYYRKYGVRLEEVRAQR